MMELIFTLLVWAALAGLMAMLLIPKLIAFARSRQLLDQPDARKTHEHPTPALGGLAIFAGTSLAVGFGLWNGSFAQVLPIASALIAVVLLGIWDDLKPLAPKAKFFVQFLLATGLFISGLRIEHGMGLFGIEAIPLAGQFALTVAVIVGVTNAVNLMDGINGLAGGIGLLSAAAFTWLFLLQGHLFPALFAACLGGACLGFLRYNVGKARIFMGDTGSLFIGLLLSYLAIHYLQIQPTPVPEALLHVFGILILPVFDTVRVFAVRVANGHSPVRPDRNHLHHLLLRAGFNHTQATLTLCLAAILLISMPQFLAPLQIPIWQKLMVLTLIPIGLSEILTIKRLLKLRHRIKQILSRQQDREAINSLINRINPSQS